MLSTSFKQIRKLSISQMYLCTSNKVFIPEEQRILKGASPIKKRVDAYLRLARFDKQIGTQLLLLPWFWSIALAAAPGTLPSIYMMSLFSIGALSARSAGCAINDYWDIDIDKYVERTKFRPLTTGEISKKQALVFFSTLTATCFGIAYLMPPLVTVLGLVSAPLVIAYPKFKRFFPYPQLMLGVTFNMGVWMGYAAIKGFVSLNLLLPMYIGAIMWTMVYDTIYAFQDIKYDKQVGLQSSAIQFENHPKSSLSALAAISIGGFGLSGYLACLHPSFYVFLGAAAGHYAWQISTLDIKDNNKWRDLFSSNRYLGLLLALGFTFGRYFQKPKKNNQDKRN